MTTFIVLIVCAIAWLRANLRYQASSKFVYRRARAQWAWAMIGGGAGSYFGLAGMGSAIAGTVPGAIVGYLVAGYLMFKRQAGEQIGPTQEQTLQAARLAGQVAGMAVAASESGAKWFLRKLWVALVWLIPIVVLGALVLSVVDRQLEHQLPIAAPVPATSSAVDKSTVSSNAKQLTTAEEFARAEFEEAVVAVELQYPVLNYRSTSYDATKADAVGVQIKRYLQNGMQPRDAVNAAVFVVMNAPPGKPTVKSFNYNGVQGSRAPDKPACEYKGVMTDEEYRNCGVRPPGSY